MGGDMSQSDQRLYAMPPQMVPADQQHFQKRLVVMYDNQQRLPMHIEGMHSQDGKVVNLNA